MSITTKALKEIVNSPNTTGVNGRDYGCPASREQLESDLFNRLTKMSLLTMVKDIKSLDDYEQYLRDIGVPELDINNEPFPNWVLETKMEIK